MYSTSLKTWKQKIPSILLILTISTAWPITSWAVDPPCTEDLKRGWTCPEQLPERLKVPCGKEGCFLIPWIRATEISQELEKAKLIPEFKQALTSMLQENTALEARVQHAEMINWTTGELAALFGGGIGFGVVTVLLLVIFGG